MGTISAEKYAVKTQPHQPFPIADFRNALFLAKQPWMSPENAFRRVENARAFRSQIVKRTGPNFFAELAAGTSSTRVISSLSLGSGISRLTYFILAVRPVINSVVFDNNAGPGAGGGPIYATVNNMRPSPSGTPGLWILDVIEQGTTNIIGQMYNDSINSWTANIVWPEHSGWIGQSTSEGYISYRVNAGSEIVGLNRFVVGSNDYSIACDPDYVYRYDLTDKYYKVQGFDGSFAGPFTGGNSDYFWYWPVDDYVVMTNNVDPVCKWDPSLAAADSVVEMPTDWTTPGTNEIDTALLVVQFGGKLVYINTVESTTRYGGRMRWTESGSPTAWRSPFDFADAPSEKGNAVSAQLIGQRLFVAFDKGWMEIGRRPGDDVQALEWLPVISRFGAVSKLSTIDDGERLLSRSKTTMQSVDPNGQTYLDVPIPDLVLGFSTRYSHLCASVRNELDRSFWWTYASQEETKPGHVLCAVYDEQNQLSWSQYALQMNVFSTFDKQGTTTWNNLGPRTLNSYAGQTPNQLGSGSQGITRVIGGQSNGMVYQFDGNAVDSYLSGNSSINFLIETQKLMAYPNGRAHFGWLDLLFELSAAAQFRVTFWTDENETPYLTKTVTMTPRGSSSKVYKRIVVGMTAMFHRFKIESLDDQPVAVDGMVPWFRNAGRARNF